MFERLTFDEIRRIIREIPEQTHFDWKQRFVFPSTDEQKGELIKDISAIANSITVESGYIFYGVNGDSDVDPIIGISESYDDARIQQLIKGKMSPAPVFLYYEIIESEKRVGVIHILPTQNRPFIITCNVGKIREGQILIRKGSSTAPISIEDLYEMFYGQHSRHFKAQAVFAQQEIQRQQLSLDRLRAAQAGADRAQNDMNRMFGF